MIIKYYLNKNKKYIYNQLYIDFINIKIYIIFNIIYLLYIIDKILFKIYNKYYF